HVVVVTGAGCLWQLRGYGKDSAPGHWDHACSGHVGLDEEPRAAAARELAEEIGVTVDADALDQLDRVLCELGNETHLTTARPPPGLPHGARGPAPAPPPGAGRPRGPAPGPPPRASLAVCLPAQRPARRAPPRLGRLATLCEPRGRPPLMRR